MVDSTISALIDAATRNTIDVIKRFLMDVIQQTNGVCENQLKLRCLKDVHPMALVQVCTNCMVLRQIALLFAEKYSVGDDEVFKGAVEIANRCSKCWGEYFSRGFSV